MTTTLSTLRPHDVFADPSAHWAFLTTPNDADFEGQHFDRKEVGRPKPLGAISKGDLKRLRHDEIASTVSAFANTNRDGGLLVLGIASDGAVAGLGHLDENQRNAIANLRDLVIGHGATSRFHPCDNDNGDRTEICLIYVPYSERMICETIGDHRAWERRGPQNMEMSADRRDAIRREKGVVDYERLPACRLNITDIDQGVVAEYRAGALGDSLVARSDEQILRVAGATELNRDGEPELTRAGALFFLANPQRVLPSATIRLLRFGVALADRDRRGHADFDREISGPVTSQINAFRTLVRDAGFFKIYQRRRPEGGFSDEPELPAIALDEAVVNAIAHRDYAIDLPIVCEKYTDAFVVRSPGLVRQQNGDVPVSFSLADRHLEHMPRNPFVMRWLRSIRDTQGKLYVQALSEGTRRMQAEMEALGLPAPTYVLNEGQTTVTLMSNAPARETALRQATSTAAATEFANLFPLVQAPRNGTSASAPDEPWRRDLLEALRERLQADGWYAEAVRKGRLTAHRRGDHVTAPGKILELVRIFPGYTFQVREYGGYGYLCVDYTAIVQSVAPVDRLLRMDIPAAELVGLRVVARWGEAWTPGRLTQVGPEFCRVHLFGPEREETIESVKVLPRLYRALLNHAIAKTGVGYDLTGEIKKASLAVQAKAARHRSDRTLKLVEHMAKTYFPLAVADGTVTLDPAPTPLMAGPDATGALALASLPEPAVEFHDGRATQNIREGITKFGAYENAPRDVELVPVCAGPHRERMAALIDRLRTGKMRYQGAERTFSTRLQYSSIVTTATEDVTAEVARLLEERPDWGGDAQLPRLFLVHTPEARYALDDERAPYYRTKRLLLERGIPCQMVDTPTLLNPDYKDLNLALNITAKVGVTPWVLPGSIPDADFFVGLSYTSSTRGDQQRLMGFANVFNQYGRWEFHSGSGEAFPYAERAAWYERLVGETLRRLEHRLSETPRIYFHYSARFSRMDRDAMLRAARALRPRGTYSFVWVNTHHPVRLYDARAEGDGSLARGSYVIGGPAQVYLSTTGFNPYRAVMGTPQALELNAYVAPREGRAPPNPDLRALAAQILSLTKLNWASTDSLCAEPITTKYAGDIAYLMAAFLRQPGPPFRLHPVLETTPWFI